MTTKTDDKLREEIEEAIENILGELEDNVAADQLTLFEPNRGISASTHATSRIQSRDLLPLNDSELKSVYALLAYVSHNENIQQETVQAIVEARFHVNHITKIQQKDYDEVIRFLVDLRIDELRN